MLPKPNEVGIIDRNGFVVLTHCTKDLIKSGGEWGEAVRRDHDFVRNAIGNAPGLDPATASLISADH